MNETIRHIRALPGLSALALLLVALAVTPSSVAAAASAAAQSPAAESGRRVLRLERIEVRGASRAPDTVVKRHLGLEPGDAVTPEVLERARLRLVATDYYQSVDLSTRRGSQRGDVVLVVDVEEHGNPVFETGFGYHDLNGWFLTLLGLRFDNVLGDDSRLRIGARLGFRLSGVDAEWTKAFGDEFGVAARLHGYNLSHRFFGSGPDSTGAWDGPGWEQFRQDIGRGGGEIALDYRPDDATTFSFGIGAERVAPDSMFRESDDDVDGIERPFDDLPGALKPGVDETTITRFFLRGIRDTRNNLAYPTAGSFARFTLDINNSFLGGDEIFTRAELDLRKHIHIRDGWVLSSHASGGMLTSDAPYYERFYLGGIYSIRGFQEWSLSETDGDDAYWTVSEELRWPLVGRPGEPPRLTGLVFVDVGQGWNRGTKLTTGDVESAAGYGLRLRLPWLGTLGIDVGIPLSNGRKDDPFRAHASLGFSF